MSISLIFLSALLTALGLYDRMAKYAGAGTLVPITGFANSMVSPALEFKSEGFVTGLGAKLFSIAGPVLVFGVSASVLYGLVLFGLSLLSRGRPMKRLGKRTLEFRLTPHHPLPTGRWEERKRRRAPWAGTLTRPFRTPLCRRRAGKRRRPNCRRRR